MTDNNLPVFEFLGYSLMDCSFHRDFDCGDPKKLFIVVNDLNVDNNGIVNMQVSVKINFQNDSESHFVYHSQFKINDMKWFDDANKNGQNQGITNMFSILFPYIRASISSITNDSLHQLYLPVIDLLCGDVTKGVSLVSTKNSKK